MCGIAGLIGMEYDSGIIKKMLQTMLRRGPDGNGTYLDKECALLHSRLAIIDPSGGAQPMRLTCGKETYIIVYNGELYNTEEIRKELYRHGHEFMGYSDTEVLLHAFVQWGEAVLEKLNGIFAFAVWKEKERKLFLARDRMGVKPLFYKFHDGGLLFASEMKTILAYPTVKAECDQEGIAELLLLGPGRTPGSGVFKGIRELKPGCCASFQEGRWSDRQYWKLLDREHTESVQETSAHVHYLVMDAIQRQMVSDVPIGTFLSGGLDSSLITAICCEQENKMGKQLTTFSVDYKNNHKYFTPGMFQPDSDNQYIEIMQSTLDTNHNWTILTPEDLVRELDDATMARDLPGMADVDFSLLAFCRRIRDHVKVALSGECADEIFGGYAWYRDPEVRAVDGFPWAQNLKLRSSYLTPEYSESLDADEFVYSRYQSTLNECDILPGNNSVDRRMKEMVNLNQQWFMQTLLDRKDRMSMYCGLEVRVPFCDYRIAEYLYAVPWVYKEYGGREKGLLRHAMQGVLPDEILWRKKSPYPKTYDPHYRSLVEGMLRGILDSKDAPILQIVRKDALQDLLTAKYDRPWYGQLMNVPQTIAFMLQINRWLELYHVVLV